jgi:hypothetical protein
MFIRSPPTSPQKTYVNCQASISDEEELPQLDFLAHEETSNDEYFYLHLFSSVKHSLVFSYYVSYEPYDVEDRLVVSNLRCKGTKTNASSFVCLDKETQEVYKNKVYDISSLEKVMKQVPQRFCVEYVFVYLVGMNSQVSRKSFPIFEKQECAICMESVCHPLYTCGHWVHAECVSKCKQLCCPMCRVECKLPSILYIHPDVRAIAEPLFDKCKKEHSKKIASVCKGKSKKAQEALVAKLSEMLL